MARLAHTRRTGLWWVLSGATAVWLLWMTLRPNPAVVADLSPLTQSAATRGISPYWLIDKVGNIAVFMPLGTILALALSKRPPGQRLLRSTLAGAGLSMLIEIAQAALPTRVAQLDDWLLNTIGTALGALAGCLIQSILEGKISRQRTGP